MFVRRMGRGGPLALVLRWLVRALGLGFVLGAVAGSRAASGTGRADAHAMADRVERALRILSGHDAAESGPAPTPSEGEA